MRFGTSGKTQDWAHNTGAVNYSEVEVVYVPGVDICVSEERLFCVPVSKIFSCPTGSKQDQLALSMTGCQWRSGVMWSIESSHAMMSHRALSRNYYCTTQQSVRVSQWVLRKTHQDWIADNEISRIVKTVIEYSRSAQTVIENSRSWNAVIKYSGSLTKTGSLCYRRQWEIRPCYRSQWESFDVSQAVGVLDWELFVESSWIIFWKL